MACTWHLATNNQSSGHPSPDHDMLQAYGYRAERMALTPQTPPREGTDEPAIVSWVAPSVTQNLPRSVWRLVAGDRNQIL